MINYLAYVNGIIMGTLWAKDADKGLEIAKKRYGPEAHVRFLWSDLYDY